MFSDALTIRQQQWRQWFGAVRFQTINATNDDHKWHHNTRQQWDKNIQFLVISYTKSWDISFNIMNKIDLEF